MESSDILLESLKVGRGCKDFCDYAYRSCECGAKGEECAPRVEGCQFYSDAQKENLHFCDNWHGIILLDVVGKLVGRIVQSRLQRLAEKKSACL